MGLLDIYINPDPARWAKLCARPSMNATGITRSVRSILSRVRRNGDDALRELSLEIDRRPLPEIEVGPAAIEKATAAIPDSLKAAINAAAANIRAFHEAQKPGEVDIETAPGVRCMQKSVPISKVGLYIPGGTAPLFSTVLMLAIPARIAGCGEVVLCSPAGKSGEIAPEVLYAASICGVDRIFRIGGAQAIAAMAYGTATVPAVDKIFGPGNRYVTTAKQMLGLNLVAIDMPAGPSEVMVIADDSAAPAAVASDLLSQAEHGADSQVMLVCFNSAFAAMVADEVNRQKALLPRESLADSSLSHSRCVVFDNQEQAVAFAQTYAPEHLIINTVDPWAIASRITAAGSVFVGPWTPESAGDYASGTNHTLPTSGWARSFSGVCLDSFMRKITFQQISRSGLEKLAPTITAMSDAEGLAAHGAAVRVRLALIDSQKNSK